MAASDDRHTRVARAGRLLGLERWDEAAETLIPLLGDDPDDAEALALLSRAHLGRRRFEEARAVAARVVALTPTDPSAHRLLASVLGDAGDRWGALAAADRAVRLGLDDWRGHVVYATVAAQLPGHSQGAWAAADRAVALAPSEPTTHFVVGLAAQSRRDTATARTAYEQTLRIDPTYVAALNNLTVLDGSTRLGRAARGYARVLALDPQERTARGNVDVLVHRFALRLYYGGAVALLVAVLVRGAGSDTTTADGGSDVHRLDRAPIGVASFVLAAVIVIVVAGYVTRLLRTIPPGIRRYAVGQATHDRRIAIRLSLAGVVLGLAVVTSVVPGAISVTPAFILPVMILNWIAFLVLRRRRG